MEGVVEVRVNGSACYDININEKFQVCIKNHLLKHVQAYGMWNSKRDLLYYVFPVTLLQISLFLIVSRLVFFILRPLKTPTFVCSTLTGILFGPSFLGRSKRIKQILFPAIQTEVLLISSWICVAYSIFLVSMKMEALVNLKNARRTWRFGIFPLFFSVFVSVFFFQAIPFFKLADHYPPFLPTVLSVTSSICTFPVISENLLELNLITSELGQIALSASVINEAVHWTYITASTVLTKPTWMYFLSSYLAFLCFCIFFIRPAMHKIARETPSGRPVKQSYVTLIQIGVLAIGALTDLLGLTFLQGPFLVGLVMPHGPPLATTIVERTELILSHFFQPLYFCYLGLTIDVSALQSWSRVFKLQFVVFVGYLVRALVSGLVAQSYDVRLKHGFVVGLMLNFKGIIEVFIFTQFRAGVLCDGDRSNYVSIGTDPVHASHEASKNKLTKGK